MRTNSCQLPSDLHTRCSTRRPLPTTQMHVKKRKRNNILLKEGRSLGLPNISSSLSSVLRNVTAFKNTSEGTRHLCHLTSASRQQCPQVATSELKRTQNWKENKCLLIFKVQSNIAAVNFQHSA